MTSVTPDPQRHPECSAWAPGRWQAGTLVLRPLQLAPHLSLAQKRLSPWWSIWLVHWIVNTFNENAGGTIPSASSQWSHSLVWCPEATQTFLEQSRAQLGPPDTQIAGTDRRAQSQASNRQTLPVRIFAIQGKNVFLKFQKFRTCSLCHLTSHFTDEDSKVQSQIHGRTHRQPNSFKWLCQVELKMRRKLVTSVEQGQKPSGEHCLCRQN